jgi:hypothetical protein
LSNTSLQAGHGPTVANSTAQEAQPSQQLSKHSTSLQAGHGPTAANSTAQEAHTSQQLSKHSTNQLHADVIATTLTTCLTALRTILSSLNC